MISHRFRKEHNHTASKVVWFESVKYGYLIMNETALRRDVYRKIMGLVKDGVDLYTVLNTIDIPKTTNMNGITINLSAISMEDLTNIDELLKHVSYKPQGPIDFEETPEPIPQVTNQTIPTYKQLKLAKTQKLILSVMK